MTPQFFAYLSLLVPVQALLVAIAAVIVWKHRAAGPGLNTVAFGLAVIVVGHLFSVVRMLNPVFERWLGKPTSPWSQARMNTEFMGMGVAYLASFAAWGFIVYGLAQFFRHLREQRHSEM